MRAATCAMVCLLSVMSAHCAQHSSALRVAVATTAPSLERGGVVVRPTEVHWALGDALAAQLDLTGAAVAAGSTYTPGVFSTQEGELPSVVKRAAVQALADTEADGILLTHYAVDSRYEQSETHHHVQLFGRFLHLSELEVFDGARADEVQGLHVLRRRLYGQASDGPPPPPRIAPTDDAVPEVEVPIAVPPLPDEDATPE